MKMKTVAALVGSLSLGVLATGCASNKASDTSTMPSESNTPAATSTDNGAGTDTGNGQSGAATTPDKGTQGSCGAGSCGGGNH